MSLSKIHAPHMVGRIVMRPFRIKDSEMKKPKNKVKIICEVGTIAESALRNQASILQKDKSMRVKVNKNEVSKGQREVILSGDRSEIDASIGLIKLTTLDDDHVSIIEY